MYLQPVFRPFVPVRQRSGRGEFSGNNFRPNSLRNECTDGSKVAPELIIRFGFPKQLFIFWPTFLGLPTDFQQQQNTSQTRIENNFLLPHGP